MDSNGKLVIERREETFLVEGDDLEERIFKVGELVEYWAGAFVRGYQRSGGPAFVKSVEGGGKSGREKYRPVEWRQMFKDGAFNKHKGDNLRRTVRTTERIQEQATVEADAKLGGY
jgi:hypothetical protein